MSSHEQFERFPFLYKLPAFWVVMIAGFGFYIFYLVLTVIAIPDGNSMNRLIMNPMNVMIVVYLPLVWIIHNLTTIYVGYSGISYGHPIKKSPLKVISWENIGNIETPNMPEPYRQQSKALAYTFSFISFDIVDNPSLHSSSQFSLPKPLMDNPDFQEALIKFAPPGNAIRSFAELYEQSENV